jgi:hypothetical protein
MDSKTTQDFISLLPLTLMMNDLFRREKFARLLRAILKEGKWTHRYEVGDVIYWPPGPDVAINVMRKLGSGPRQSHHTNHQRSRS